MIIIPFHIKKISSSIFRWNWVLLIFNVEFIHALCSRDNRNLLNSRISLASNVYEICGKLRHSMKHKHTHNFILSLYHKAASELHTHFELFPEIQKNGFYARI